LGLQTTLLINEHSKAGYKVSNPHDKTIIKNKWILIVSFVIDNSKP
jgi:hypothetical protein